MKQLLLKIFFIALIGITFQDANGQSKVIRSGNSDNESGQNLVKINLTALPLNSYSFLYERAIGEKFSVGLGLRVMPKGKLPFLNQIEKNIDDPDASDILNDLTTGNTAFTPEIRYYAGKGIFKGMYIAPFVRFAKYTASHPSFIYEFYNPATNETSEESIPLDGQLTSVTGGLLLGAQWKLGKILYLDWSIFGPNYGSSKGYLKGTKTLTAEQQDALREELDELDLPMVESSSVVNSQGATLNMKGPWAGLRASIGLGVSF